MTKPSNARSLLSATDSLIALALAVGAVVWANQQRMPQGGLGEFLEIPDYFVERLVFNRFRCALAAMHGGARSLSAVMPSCSVPRLASAAGVGIMTVLLGLYLEARRAEGPVVQILVAFFIAAFCLSKWLASSFPTTLLGDDRVIPSKSLSWVADGGRPRPGGNLRTQHHRRQDPPRLRR